jgi:septation ring formation regulator EzrA
MVKKFLTREQTYSMLLSNVSESEAKIDALKKDNEHLRSRLHDLKIDDNDQQKAGGNDINRFQDETII